MVTIGAGAERGPSLFFPARSRGGPNIEHKETPFRLTRLGAFLVLCEVPVCPQNVAEARKTDRCKSVVSIVLFSITTLAQTHIYQPFQRLCILRVVINNHTDDAQNKYKNNQSGAAFIWCYSTRVISKIGGVFLSSRVYSILQTISLRRVLICFGVDSGFFIASIVSVNFLIFFL